MDKIDTSLTSTKKTEQKVKFNFIRGGTRRRKKNSRMQFSSIVSSSFFISEYSDGK
jgi:hypothetical protein